jgi:hypothetical protein
VAPDSEVVVQRILRARVRPLTLSLSQQPPHVSADAHQGRARGLAIEPACPRMFVDTPYAQGQPWTKGMVPLAMVPRMLRMPAASRAERQ